MLEQLKTITDHLFDAMRVLRSAGRAAAAVESRRLLDARDLERLGIDATVFAAIRMV